VIHTFTAPGTYNVTATVTDASANATETWILIHVTSPPGISAFSSFISYTGGLFFSVIEGIVEVGAVVLPIALVVLGVFIPLRNRLRSQNRQEAKQS
jgi:hypothetical protein